MGARTAVMQSGFAFLEADSVRTKSTTNIIMKNFVTACTLTVLLRQEDVKKNCRRLRCLLLDMRLGVAVWQGQ